jgi:phosphatidate cytidylyltransferase
LLLLAIVALGDTLAYFTGRRFGKHKLAPSVSPKKTWEGSIGGFVGSLLAAAVWSHFVLDQVEPRILLVAAATAIMAQAGDLVESVVKRAAGVKDSSQVLPGHGGFYDRLDAMILGAPTFVVGVWLAGF